MSVSGELLCSFELLKPLDSTALKNHIKKGRNKRNSMLNSPVSPPCFSDYLPSYPHYIVDPYPAFPKPLVPPYLDPTANGTQPAAVSAQSY